MACVHIDRTGSYNFFNLGHLKMPQIATLPLTVGPETVNYVPVGTQNGDKPSMFATVGDTLSLDQQSTLTHLVTQGSANRIVRAHGVLKKVYKANDINVVAASSSFDVKLTFPKLTVIADRERVIDTLIAYLTSQRDMLARAEILY